MLSDEKVLSVFTYEEEIYTVKAVSYETYLDTVVIEYDIVHDTPDPIDCFSIYRSPVKPNRLLFKSHDRGNIPLNVIAYACSIANLVIFYSSTENQIKWLNNKINETKETIRQIKGGFVKKSFKIKLKKYESELDKLVNPKKEPFEYISTLDADLEACYKDKILHDEIVGKRVYLKPEIDQAYKDGKRIETYCGMFNDWYTIDYTPDKWDDYKMFIRVHPDDENL